MASSKKALVIGIDGLPATLIEKYMDDGILPNFKRILSAGFNLNQMDASIPDVSSTSWTSFMTGVNPAEHGIYGFMELRPGTYKLAFPNFNDVKAPAIWEITGGTTRGKTSTLNEKYKGLVKDGSRSVVMNIPQTFPALPMNGILTAGFVCPDFKKGTYPESAYDYLNSIGYLPDIDANRAVEDADAFFDEAFLALRKREEAYTYFLRNGDWGLFIGVITETDRIHHFFFDAAYDKGHRYHEMFIGFYKKLDETVGRLFDIFMEMTGGTGLFMTMSDHGFTKIKREFYINPWLKENGYLNLNASREFYEMIDAWTRAFAMDPARIYINAEGRYPLGSVRRDEKEALCREMKEKLLALKDSDGSPVVKAVYEKDELYSGPSKDMAPDLVCIGHDGYDLKSNLKKNDIFGNSHFKGMHTRHDAHCVISSGIKTPERLQIEDLAGIILENLLG